MNFDTVDDDWLSAANEALEAHEAIPAEARDESKKRKSGTPLDSPSPQKKAKSSESIKAATTPHNNYVTPNTTTTYGLPDIIKAGLKILFIGDNPGLQSAKEGHWFSHHTNHFWPLLYESGLITEPLTHREDKRVLEYGIGLTCLVKRSTSSTAELSAQELKNGFQQVKAKLRLYKPQAICFNGKSIYQTVTGLSCSAFGLQKTPLAVADTLAIACFVVPSTSARVTAYTKEQKLAYFKQLKAFVDKKS